MALTTLTRLTAAAWIVPPEVTPGGSPVTAVPGLTPRFAPSSIAPVLVTVAPPSTAKLDAVPGRAASYRALLDSEKG